MVETTAYKNKARIYSTICTLLLAAGLLLILLFIILRTPIPPYPEGGGGAGTGIEINLGSSDAGMGDNQQELATTQEKEQASQSTPSDNQFLTQDEEEAPVINENPKTKKNKKEPLKEVVETTKPAKKEVEKPKQVVNTKALYPSKSNQTSSEGDKNTTGDQGNPDGNLAAKTFGNKGGEGGSGGGTGGGIGTGTGKGTGSGISYVIGKRVHLSLPNPEYKGQSEGVVIVEVTVDKEGRVTQAIPGKKGTTTTDDHLWNAAKAAALQARFDRKPDAPPFEKGTITYRFRLQ